MQTQIARICFRRDWFRSVKSVARPWGFTVFFRRLHNFGVLIRDTILEGQGKPMNTSKKFLLLIVLGASVAAGCKANISRNDNGTFTIQTTVSQQQLQEIITSSIADPLVKGVTVTLQSGHVLVAGERARLNDPNHSDQMSFRLDLGAQKGRLTSTISNAVLDGIAIEQNRVDLWNERIAYRLALLGDQSGSAALQSVVITPQAVTMTWTTGK